MNIWQVSVRYYGCYASDIETSKYLNTAKTTCKSHWKLAWDYIRWRLLKPLQGDKTSQAMRDKTSFLSL